ncbi:MAG: prolipoprotein diacylglyceryl transferase [Alphaproteobacteria bacterium]|nr:prolipoprotein diacylglyceryl transferase [Alphaproteobacteria bacterium]
MRLYEALLPYPKIDPVLVHLGPFAIRWYALAYIAGLLLGWWLVLKEIAQKSLWKNPPFKGKAPATDEQIGDLVVWATFGVILGGRLGWDLFYGIILCSGDQTYPYCYGLPWGFLHDPIKIIAAWQGGMSFHGGLIGVALALWLFAGRRKLDMVRIGDLIATVAPIGLFFGRLANFINGELWGRPTDVPWAMIFPNPLAGAVPRHPSQLYEAGLEGIVLFAILQLGLRKLRWHEKPGLLIAVFFLGYGVFRSFVEMFREPDAPFLGPITMGQMLSAVMLAVAAYFFWYALWRRKAVVKEKA